MEFDTEKYVTVIMRSRKKTKNGNRTAKLRRKNTWRKGNLQVHGNIGKKHYQTNGDERKNRKGVS